MIQSDAKLTIKYFQIIRDAPWTLTDDFLDDNQIDFVAHDDEPYTLGSGEDVYKSIKERGMFMATQRTEGISTSGLYFRSIFTSGSIYI